MKKVVLLAIGIFLLTIAIVFSLIYVYCAPVYNINYIDKIKVNNYNKSTNEMTLSINFSKNYKNMECGFSNGKDIKWVSLKKEKCVYKTKVNNLKYVYLKKGMFERREKIDSLLVNIDTFDKIYISKGEKKKINNNSVFIGREQYIIYKSKNNKIVSFDKDVVIGKKIGSCEVDVIINGKVYDTFTIIVTDLINERTKKLNNNKEYLECNRYTKKETEILDDILENKVENAGYKTRAGVVEAARFLTLDFKYKIDYFFENGRLSGGQNYVDGEGRYYHKGLYLDESKFKKIEKSFSGPSIWGCPLKNFEDYGTKYKKGSYNSNGLDCSGFVSWAFLNGGFDIGDKGSGDNEKDETEINDIGGTKVKATDELFETDKVKAGDMIGYWGHIGLIIGIDDDNVYIAESLWTFGGVALNKYKKDEVSDEFTQVILLDDFYKENGNYTDMWYL